MFLKHGSLPGEGETQHDLASDAPPAAAAAGGPAAPWAAAGSWWRDGSVHLTLRKGDAAWRPGEAVSLKS